MKKRVFYGVMGLTFLAVLLLVVLAWRETVPQQQTGERIAALEERYGMPIVFDQSILSSVPAQLDELESAFLYLGPVFTTTVATQWDFLIDTEAYYADEAYFSIQILPAEDDNTFAMTGYPIGGVQLYIQADGSVATCRDIIHEFGHTIHYSELAITFDEYIEAFEEVTLDDRRRIKETESLYPTYYITSYAAFQYMEDYAENFAHMILHGGNEPTSQTEEMWLYRRMQLIYRDLEASFGGGSRATRRVGGYLNIPLEAA